MNKPTINSSLQSPRYLDKVDDLTAGLDKLRPGTGGAINFLLRDAYEEGRKAAELGDGEPSPKYHCACCKNLCEKPGIWCNYCFTQIAMNSKHKCGAAQEVSPSANFVSEIRPRPDDPSCHVCGAQMVVKEWKCLSCKATTGVEEVSPPSPELITNANDLLRRLNKEVFNDAVDMYRLPEAVGWVIDFAKENGGDTRELKAALRQALLIHWLSQIECNHEEKNDSAICACGWKSERGFNVGKAVELWIDHVFAELG